MRKRLIIAALGFSIIAMCKTSAYATPPAELYIGAAQVWTHAPNDHFDTQGGGGSITGYFNYFLGAEAEIFKYVDNPQGFKGVYSTHYTILFGPHLAVRGIPFFTPFAHALIGVTRGTNYNPQPPPPALPETSSALTERTAFTVGFGGGLDLNAWHFISFRVIQADYLRAYFPNTENSVRLSAGIVFHL